MALIRTGVPTVGRGALGAQKTNPRSLAWTVAGSTGREKVTTIAFGAVVRTAWLPGVVGRYLTRHMRGDLDGP